MFKKFDAAEDVVGSQQLKGSAQKAIRTSLLSLFPAIEQHIDAILPKKESFRLVRCRDHLELVVDAHGCVLFIKHRDLPYFPTLRLLHQYPMMLTHQQVDRGAIKFVLNGSNIMCPGLTSAGGRLKEGCPVGSLVAVMAEGKQHAMAIGQMKMAPTDIRTSSKGIAIENIHCLGDGLWRAPANIQ